MEQSPLASIGEVLARRVEHLERRLRFHSVPSLFILAVVIIGAPALDPKEGKRRGPTSGPVIHNAAGFLQSDHKDQFALKFLDFQEGKIVVRQISFQDDEKVELKQ